MVTAVKNISPSNKRMVDILLQFAPYHRTCSGDTRQAARQAQIPTFVGAGDLDSPPRLWIDNAILRDVVKDNNFEFT